MAVTWLSYPTDVKQSVRTIPVQVQIPPGASIANLEVVQDESSQTVSLYEENGVVASRVLPVPQYLPDSYEVYLQVSSIDDHDTFVQQEPGTVPPTPGIYPDERQSIVVTLLDAGTGQKTTPIYIRIAPYAATVVTTEKTLFSDDFPLTDLSRNKWTVIRYVNGAVSPIDILVDSSALRVYNSTDAQVYQQVFSEIIEGRCHVEFRDALEIVHIPNCNFMFGVYFLDEDDVATIPTTSWWNGGMLAFGFSDLIAANQVQLHHSGPFNDNIAASNVNLPAGLTTGLHTYSIDFDGHVATFAVDGVVVGTFTTRIPGNSSKRYSVGITGFTGGAPPAQRRYFSVNRVDVASDEILQIVSPDASGAPAGIATEATQQLNRVLLDSLMNQGKAAVSAAETSVVAANASTQLLAANPSRRMFAIRNDSDKPMYVAYGGAASLSSVTKIPPSASNGYYEDTKPPWTGTVFAFGEAGGVGNWRVREIT